MIRQIIQPLRSLVFNIPVLSKPVCTRDDDDIEFGYRVKAVLPLAKIYHLPAGLKAGQSNLAGSRLMGEKGMVACINKTQTMFLALRLFDTNRDVMAPPKGKERPSEFMLNICGG